MNVFSQGLLLLLYHVFITHVFRITNDAFIAVVVDEINQIYYMD